MASKHVGRACLQRVRPLFQVARSEQASHHEEGQHSDAEEETEGWDEV